MVFHEPALPGNWIGSFVHFVFYSISAGAVLGGLINFQNAESWGEKGITWRIFTELWWAKGNRKRNMGC